MPRGLAALRAIHAKDRGLIAGVNGVQPLYFI